MEGSGSLKPLKIRIGGPVESQPFPYTYEEQIIVRFPPSIASQLREELRETHQPEDFSVTFITNRLATVIFHGRTFAGILLDLPTIIETHKTFDRSQYYKTADICQILLVLPEGAETAQKIKEYEANGWQFPDGITPPMKNVRARRFKHTNSYGRQKDVEAIEKRVQALLDKDSQAVSSTFIVYDSMGKAVLTGGGADGKYVRLKPDDGGEIEMEPEPEASLSQEESSGDEEFAAELEEEMLAEEAPEDAPEELSAETTASNVAPTPTPTQSPAVVELQAKINERKAQLATVSNPLIKARLEDVIKQLEQDLQSRMK